MRFLNACIACLGLFGLSSAWSCDLRVEAPWVRAAPAGATALAAYAKLSNTGVRQLTIVAIRSDSARMAMLHESAIHDGIAQMRMLDALTIAPGAAAILAPAGKHIMLSDLNSVPSVGSDVMISLIDASGCTTVAAFPVKADGGAARPSAGPLR